MKKNKKKHLTRMVIWPYIMGKKIGDIKTL